jgi:hypothetical protein
MNSIFIIGIIDYAVPVHYEPEKSYGDVDRMRRIPSMLQNELQLDSPCAGQTHTEDGVHEELSFDGRESL